MNTKQSKVREALKNIPSIDEILSIFQKNYKLDVPLDYFKFELNNELDYIRKQFKENLLIDNSSEFIKKRINNFYNKINLKSLKPVINGTGIILHTGLGRAPISKDILIEGILQNYPYSNLEINLKNGKRGDRNVHISNLISSICNCEQSIAVNNNAAAVMLTLNAICSNKQVIISRGQQVEIGGSFRIPDVISKSQSKMVEVGTTNKTHLNDYEIAINNKTAAILYVHTSNYKVIGFTSEVAIDKLSKLSNQHNIPLIVDLGSGSIADFKSQDLPMEKMVRKYFSMGADIITFSGDKLLAGPQSGIISGKSKWIEIIKNNSIYRAVRCDKIRISILENILRTYHTSKKITDKNLSVQLFLRNQDQLRKNAKTILKKIPKKVINKYKINIFDSFVEAGSGSLPTEKINSVALSFSSIDESPEKIYKKFISLKIPIIGYIHKNKFNIDLKAIPDDQLEILIDSISVL